MSDFKFNCNFICFYTFILIYMYMYMYMYVYIYMYMYMYNVYVYVNVFCVCVCALLLLKNARSKKEVSLIKIKHFKVSSSDVRIAFDEKRTFEMREITR